jgi:hypothetical protein
MLQEVGARSHLPRRPDISAYIPAPIWSILVSIATPLAALAPRNRPRNDYGVLPASESRREIDETSALALQRQFLLSGMATAGRSSNLGFQPVQNSYSIHVNSSGQCQSECLGLVSNMLTHATANGGARGLAAENRRRY